MSTGHLCAIEVSRNELFISGATFILSCSRLLMLNRQLADRKKYIWVKTTTQQPVSVGDVLPIAPEPWDAGEELRQSI